MTFSKDSIFSPKLKKILENMIEESKRELEVRKFKIGENFSTQEKTTSLEEQISAKNKAFRARISCVFPKL